MEKQININQVNSYLTFRLGEEIYAAHVSQVLNILEMVSFTEVPKAPAYMKGVINLRGMVLPLIDTRIKLGLPDISITTDTCIIVMDIEDNGDIVHVGGIVDQVLAVIEIDDKEILPPPNIGTNYSSSFITGVAKSDENFVMILDLIKIFSSNTILD